MRGNIMLVTIGLFVAGCAGEAEREAAENVEMPASCRSGKMQLCMQELARQNPAGTGATSEQQQIINKFMQDMMGSAGMSPQRGQTEAAPSRQQAPQEQSSQKEKSETALDSIPAVPQPPVPQVIPDSSLPVSVTDLPGTAMPAEGQAILEESQHLPPPQDATMPAAR